MFKIENSYSGLGEFLILGEFRCFINKLIIKKDFTKKKKRTVKRVLTNGEYGKLEKRL